MIITNLNKKNKKTKGRKTRPFSVVNLIGKKRKNKKMLKPKSFGFH